MAIPEVCSLWLEERALEELENKDETGKSYGEIARMLAGEVERYFEVEVNPETIKSRVYRAHKKVSSNETDDKNDAKSGNKENLEKLEKPRHGGARRNSGRKPKADLNETTVKKACTEKSVLNNFSAARYQMVGEIRNLGRLSTNGKLTDDHVFKEIENQLRLILDEAREVGIFIQSPPTVDKTKTIVWRGPVCESRKCSSEDQATDDQISTM